MANESSTGAAGAESAKREQMRGCQCDRVDSATRALALAPAHRIEALVRFNSSRPRETHSYLVEVRVGQQFEASRGSHLVEVRVGHGGAQQRLWERSEVRHSHERAVQLAG